MAKILITGGTGFAGSYLAELLLRDEAHQVHVTGLSQPTDVWAKKLPTAIFHQLDLTQKDAVDELISQIKPDQIYHLAALTAVGASYDSAQQVLINNINAQLFLLDAVKQHAPQARVLCIGSAEEYGLSCLDYEKVPETAELKPLSPYAVSKVTQEVLALMYQRVYQMEVIVARPFNHIGPGQTDQFVASAFAKQIVAIERGQQTEIKVGNLTAVRDFSDVQDVVRAYQILMTRGVSGEVYNIGSGLGVSIETLLTELTELSSAEIRVVPDPTRLRPSDVTLMIADTGKIQALGWRPQINLSTTLANIVSWWRQQNEGGKTKL